MFEKRTNYRNQYADIYDFNCFKIKIGTGHPGDSSQPLKSEVVAHHRRLGLFQQKGPATAYHKSQ